MKTRGQIIRENVCTLFNFLNVTIAILLFAAGAYSNMAFILIVIANVVIGIVQELKARKMVEELSLLNRPKATVLRNGEEVTIDPAQITLEDVLVLRSGDQICNDAVVASGTIEVDESLLTGESDPVIKEAGDQLYSGSFVVSGFCKGNVIHVGEDNYAQKLTDEVKQEKQSESELLGSMRAVTRWTGFLIIPLGILLFLEATVLRGEPFDTAIMSFAAALLGMLPKGLVLLISVSLAMGVIRLSRMKILVQNMYALEALARVDVLCLDKTGTITDGEMKVCEKIDAYGMPPQFVQEMLEEYLGGSEDNNATIRALRAKYNSTQQWKIEHRIPFSSRRKWGAVGYTDKGTVFLGAPEKIYGNLDGEAECQMREGRRVVAIGYAEGIWTDDARLPGKLMPVCMIALADTIRKDADKTLAYFKREGVDVRVISGDHLKTVSMIAKKAGLERWAEGIDMSELGDSIDYDEICSRYAIFARVTPEQKQLLVRALKRQGHHVAMTGDGVNDLLALREADCSIAISEGSDASRQIAQIVLLDSDFTHLPQVVLEGRRVINNVTRTAGVFFIKTIYSVLLSFICLFCNIPFPFIPIQITLVDAFVEAQRLSRAPEAGRGGREERQGQHLRLLRQRPRALRHRGVRRERQGRLRRGKARSTPRANYCDHGPVFLRQPRRADGQGASRPSWPAASWRSRRPTRIPRFWQIQGTLLRHRHIACREAPRTSAVHKRCRLYSQWQSRLSAHHPQMLRRKHNPTPLTSVNGQA